jgi:signal transduction histidine kinase
MSASPDDPIRPSPQAVLAHELRAPLASIVSVAEVMASEALGPLPEAYVAYARLIGDTGLHLLEVVAALAAEEMSEGEAPLDPRRLVTDALSLFEPRARAAGVGLDLALPDSPQPTAVTAAPFRQILFNLLDNALKATARGGRIQVSLQTTGRGVALEVKDSGGAAFAGGRGLGLSIVRALCAAQGGTFDLRLAEGGASANARLPLRGS